MEVRSCGYWFEGMCHTLYSNIFDPVNLALYLNYGENYQQ
jgi:hypothetical protein